MSTTGDQIKSVVGISALVSFYGIASLLVVYLGPSIGLSYAYEIIIIALLLLTWPFAILINHMRKRRASKREAAAAAEPAVAGAPPQPVKGGSAPKRVHEELARGAEEAVQWLRSTRLGGAKSSDALYALPWYIVAGPTASGKTSLVLSSGLDFHALPSQRRAEMKIVRPTHHVDWRVTDSALLLDTSGRYQSDGPSRDEWIALTETIRKYRHSRALDGFLVAVNAARILQASETEIEQQAKTLRARLDEIIQLARARFPVYLVFTHIDALSGFEEFFKDGKSAAEVWGATIPLDKSANAHALFDLEFDQLYDSLVRRRLLRLRTPVPAERQLQIFDFPVRFGEARAKLGLFASALFRPNPFSESPLLRGFYFTANLTRGGAQAGAASDDGGERAAQAVGAGFFTDRFFKEVVLKDKDLAASFQASKKKPPRTGAILLILGAFALFALLAGAVVSYVTNRKLIADAVDRATKVSEIRQADQGKDVLAKDPAAARVEIEAVEALRQIAADLDTYDQKSPPWYMRFGLYSGGSADSGVDSYVRHIYFDAIQQRYFNSTVAAVEHDLQTFAATDTTTTTNTSDSSQGNGPSAEEILGRNYDLLKAYLMLGEPERVEPTFLASQLGDYWKRSSPPDMEIVSQYQLNFFAGQAAREDTQKAKIDARLVAAVRSKLAAYPPANRYYKRIVTEINAKTTPVSIDTVLEGRGRNVLTGTYIVQGSYTIDGYRNYMKSTIENAGEEISKDDWVMGTPATSSTQTQSTDISKLQSMYFAQYTDEWRRFVRGITVKPFKTTDEAVGALKALSATDSPMELVMSAVAKNTNLSAKPESAGWWGWIKSWFSTNTGEDTGGKTQVEKEFKPLFQFVSSGENKKENSAMTQYRADLKGVVDQLELTSQKDEPGLQKGQQAINGLLEPFKTPAAADVVILLQQPLGNLRAFYYGVEYEKMVKIWSEQIYPKTRALESGYPFTDSGEASLTDVAAFLNPVNGQLTTFFNNNLAGSFDEAQGQWKLKEAGKFSDDFVKYLNSARKLREALFANGGQNPEVGYNLTLQPVPNADVVIDIDGTKIETRGSSPQSVKFTWPARSGSSGATITVIPNGGQEASQTFSGTWGLFKMIDAGSHGLPGADQLDLSWNVGTVQVRATLQPASAANNPFQRALFRNLRAPQNLQK
jgi:type VI secretion system protein ImpL